MKNKIYSLFFLFALLLSSCCSDDSNESIGVVNPIQVVIDDVNMEEDDYVYKSVQQFEELSIEPIIYKEGTPDANLSYEWVIRGNDIVQEVVGTDLAIKWAVHVVPNSYYYTLLLTITDEDTQLKRYVEVRVTVYSRFVKGLVVADTRDEIDSDLSVVVSRNFNYDIEDGVISSFQDVFSEANGRKVNGLVKLVKTTSYGTNRSLTLGSNEEYIRGDHYDYEINESESYGGMFIIAPEVTNPQKIVYHSSYGMEILLNDGNLYPRSCQNSNRYYGFYVFPSSRPVINVTSADYSSGGYLTWFYDSIAEGYLTYDGLTVGIPTTTGLFDIASMPGKTHIHLGLINGTSYQHMIMRDNATGDITSYCMQVGYKTYTPYSIIDLTVAPNINNANCFATNPSENRLYYSDDTTVYSYSLANYTEKAQFVVTDPNEVITDLKLWEESAGYIRYKNLTEDADTDYVEVSAYRRMMLITTYNSVTGEGKVTAVPIPILNGDWEQDTSYHIVYGGFGRILAITNQAG